MSYTDRTNQMKLCLPNFYYFKTSFQVPSPSLYITCPQLPIASYLRTARVSWGDHRTTEGFLFHFFRKDYGTLKLVSSDNFFLAQIGILFLLCRNNVCSDKILNIRWSGKERGGCWHLEELFHPNSWSDERVDNPRAIACSLCNYSNDMVRKQSVFRLNTFVFLKERLDVVAHETITWRCLPLGVPGLNEWIFWGTSGGGITRC